MEPALSEAERIWSATPIALTAWPTLFPLATATSTCRSLFRICPGVGVGQQVRVGAQGEGDGAVAQAGRDQRGVHAGRQQQARACVSEIVEAGVKAG